MPQLPKDQNTLDKPELDKLVSKAVQMLVDYAKQCLADANAFVMKAQQKLSEQEIEHADNKYTKDEQAGAITLQSDELRDHLDLMDRAMHLTSEALDVPQMKFGPEDTKFLHLLVSTYLERREEVDRIINQHKEKWRVERMVSIDRDILRLACTEAFFLKEVPINVCISEAVELSHRFADERAAKFINGVLRDVAEEAKVYRQTGKFGTAAQEA
jgi:N utilization substance protein B